MNWLKPGKSKQIIDDCITGKYKGIEKTKVLLYEVNFGKNYFRIELSLN